MSSCGLLGKENLRKKRRVGSTILLESSNVELYRKFTEVAVQNGF